MENFNFLFYSEEKKLTLDEKIIYYQNMKKHLKEQKNNPFNKTYMNICTILNKHFVRFVIDKIKGYELSVAGLENIPKSPVIYASTHQDYHDHFNAVLAIPEHVIILNTNTVTTLFKMIMSVNGIVYVNRNDSNSRFQSKIDLMSCLAKGKSIVIFPEASWNCSPNKLHLPLYSGVIDMARKMQVPIVPLVQEYDYQVNNKSFKCVKSCQVVFGNPIYISYEDDMKTKKDELSEQFSTIKWNLMNKKGVFSRKIISNQEYINYVLSRIDGWKQIDVKLEDERHFIKGYGSEAYYMSYIDDVLFDNKGNLLLPPEVIKLIKLNEEHLDICYDRNGNFIDIKKVLTLSRKSM